MGAKLCPRLDRVSAVEVANHQCALQLLRVRPANVLAGRLDSILCASRKPVGILAAGACDCLFDYGHGFSVCAPPAKSISDCRLALVPRDAGTGDWNRAG